jgi:hypothetical protein
VLKSNYLGCHGIKLYENMRVLGSRSVKVKWGELPAREVRASALQGPSWTRGALWVIFVGRPCGSGASDVGFRLRTHVDAHRASGCLWQNQPTNFKKKREKRRKHAISVRRP